MGFKKKVGEVIAGTSLVSGLSAAVGSMSGALGAAFLNQWYDGYNIIEATRNNAVGSVLLTGIVSGISFAVTPTFESGIEFPMRFAGFISSPGGQCLAAMTGYALLGADDMNLITTAASGALGSVASTVVIAGAVCAVGCIIGIGSACYEPWRAPEQAPNVENPVRIAHPDIRPEVEEEHKENHEQEQVNPTPRCKSKGDEAERTSAYTGIFARNDQVARESQVKETDLALNFPFHSINASAASASPKEGDTGSTMPSTVTNYGLFAAKSPKSQVDLNPLAEGVQIMPQPSAPPAEHAPGGPTII